MAPTQPKIEMATAMIQQQIPVHMEVMGPEDVDGHYVKHLQHGMGLSLLTLFDKAYTQIQGHEVRGENDFSRASLIRYTSSECTYEFDFSATPIQGRVLWNH